jgi:hypothetical protein
VNIVDLCLLQKENQKNPKSTNVKKCALLKPNGKACRQVSSTEKCEGHIHKAVKAIERIRLAL